MIVVGSTNPAKVSAVRGVMHDYPVWGDLPVHPANVRSGVPDQPIGLHQILAGAGNRAAGAFAAPIGNVRLGVGIESGLFPVPNTLTGFMDVCCAVLRDGRRFYQGLSSAFECPPSVISQVNRGHELAHAFKEAGLHPDNDIGKDLGAIGRLTDGRCDRAQFTAQALINAMIMLDKSELYWP